LQFVSECEGSVATARVTSANLRPHPACYASVRPLIVTVPPNVAPALAGRGNPTSSVAPSTTASGYGFVAASTTITEWADKSKQVGAVTFPDMGVVQHFQFGLTTRVKRSSGESPVVAEGTQL
jgi:hypothetical protein